MREQIFLGGLFDLDNKIKRVEEINKLMLNSSFWDDRETADRVVQELKVTKEIIEKFNNLNKKINDNIDIINNFSDDLELVDLSIAECDELKKDIYNLELETYLNGEYDSNNAIVEIHAGAGGTESCDWVSMLYRMYTRYAGNNGFIV